MRKLWSDIFAVFRSNKPEHLGAGLPLRHPLISWSHFVHSEAGYNHKNEDTVEVRSHPENSAILLCALADGQGGRPGGAAASQIAMEACLSAAAAYSAKQLLDGSIWHRILSQADDTVAAATEAGYTTLTALCIVDNRVCGASCGDSAVLLINGQEHSVLTDRQRKNPPVGSGAAAPVPFSAKIDQGFRLLAVSDGVWKYVAWEAIISHCAKQKGQSLISAIRQMALEQNGGKLPDDFSIALIQ